MNRAILAVLSLLLVLVTTVWSYGEILVVEDPKGAVGRAAAPVSVDVDLSEIFGDVGLPQVLYVVEVTGGQESTGPPVAAQFEPIVAGKAEGKLWWMMPPGEAGVRRFQLVRDSEQTAPALTVEIDGAGETLDIQEGPLKVLRYNHGTVPVPEGIGSEFARSGYVHPLFGPDGESLTDDYSPDGPHHRGVSWAWPRTVWKGETRDLWAVSIERSLSKPVGGLWSRPVAVHRAEGGPVWAAISGENVWKWGDEDSIVREEVLIRAFRQQAERRFIDFELRFTALVDEVSLWGQRSSGYGGFNLRTYPEFPERKITAHRDPLQESLRRAWFHLTGRFPGGARPAGVVMFEHVTNPAYPNHPPPYDAEGEPVEEYPPWRTVMPSYPGDREVPLPKGEPLVLKYRLWIHPEEVTTAELTDAWAAYAFPARLAN